MKYGFRIPFIDNYKQTRKAFITINRVQTFLGGSFYPRLSTIYSNLVQAISKKNYRYLSSYLQPTFAHKLIAQIAEADNQRYRIKLKNPQAKIILIKPKKFKKYLKFRQNIWNNEVTKIGLTCNVFFGQIFDRDQPFGKEQLKKFKIGQFRYIVYDPSLSFFTNCFNCYKYQTYEFIINCTSKLHLQVFSLQENQKRTIYDDKKQDTERTSEIVMRSSHEKFDWVITDINGLATK